MELDATQKMALKLLRQGRETAYVAALCRKEPQWVIDLCNSDAGAEYQRELAIEVADDLPDGYDWDTQDFERAYKIAHIDGIRRAVKILRDVKAKAAEHLEALRQIAPRVKEAPRILDKTTPDVELHDHKTTVITDMPTGELLRQYMERKRLGRPDNDEV